MRSTVRRVFNLPVGQQLGEVTLVVGSAPAADRPLAERDREDELAFGAQPLAEPVDDLPVEVLDGLVVLEPEAGDGRQRKDRVEGLRRSAPLIDRLFHHGEVRVSRGKSGGERGDAQAE